MSKSWQLQTEKNMVSCSGYNYAFHTSATAAVAVHVVVIPTNQPTNQPRPKLCSAHEGHSCRWSCHASKAHNAGSTNSSLKGRRTTADHKRNQHLALLGVAQLAGNPWSCRLSIRKSPQILCTSGAVYSLH